MNIQCLVVDDEPLAVDLIVDFISKIPCFTLVGRFHDPLKAITFIELNKVDVVFLDINMPSVTGLEFSLILSTPVRIVFTTAYKDYALDSYERNALDYLLKPITFERFLKSVDKIKQSFFLEKAGNSGVSVDQQVLFVKSGKKLIQVDLNEVLYIKGMKDYAVFHYKNQKILVAKRLKDLDNILPSFFQRIHLSYLVNENHIKKIEDNHVFIADTSISISNKYRTLFLEKIGKRTL